MDTQLLTPPPPPPRWSYGNWRREVKGVDGLSGFQVLEFSGLVVGSAEDEVSLLRLVGNAVYVVRV
jgi:hypothetical protein